MGLFMVYVYLRLLRKHKLNSWSPNKVMQVTELPDAEKSCVEVLRQMRNVRKSVYSVAEWRKAAQVI